MPCRRRQTRRPRRWPSQSVSCGDTQDATDCPSVCPHPLQFSANCDHSLAKKKLRIGCPQGFSAFHPILRPVPLTGLPSTHIYVNVNNIHTEARKGRTPMHLVAT